MSALLTKPTGYGANATFWRLDEVKIKRRPHGSMEVSIAGYVDEAAFKANAEPIAYWKKTYAAGDMPFDPNNLIPNTPAYLLFGQSYLMVMTEEFFSEAKPV